MKQVKKLVCLVLALAVFMAVAVLPVGAVSLTPYKGYNYDHNGFDIDAPVGYVPDKTYSIDDMNIPGTIASANDLFVYNDELVYLVDSHYNDSNDANVTESRVIVLDRNLNYVKEITSFKDKETGEAVPFVNPVGVYVTEDEIFVCCDIKVQEVNEETGTSTEYYDGVCLVADHDGNITRKFTNPTGKTLLVDLKDFRPMEVVQDNAGYVYIRCAEVLEGLLVFNAEGEFMQYYGANKTVLNFGAAIEQMWKKLLSRSAQDTMGKTVPTEMSSIFVDDEGFIYTTTPNESVEKSLRLRKLNAGGNNVMKSDKNIDLELIYGDRFTGTQLKMGDPQSSFADIFVDERDVVAVLDQKYGRVFVYDETSTLLTVFGRKTVNSISANGCTLLPSKIIKVGEKYVILDQGSNTLAVYRPTEYMQRMLIADYYYMEGWYVEGEEYWREVLKYDANNTRAYAAIGKSYLEQERYEESLEYLKKGYDRTSYSTAYSEYRSEYLRANIGWLLPVVIVAVILVVQLFKLIRRLLGFKDKKTKIKFG